jgi:hypothetical protein
MPTDVIYEQVVDVRSFSSAGIAIGDVSALMTSQARSPDERSEIRVGRARSCWPVPDFALARSSGLRVLSRHR